MNSDELDSALERLPMEPAPPGLNGRILAELPADPWQSLIDWMNGSVWRPTLAAAFSLALGFLIGVSQTDSADQEFMDDLGTLAFSADFEELPYDD